MNTIQERINSYLSNESDYSFELRCLHAINSMNQCDFRVSHSGTYKDDLTNKLRQFDIRATFWPRKNLNHILHTAVECKRLSKEAPLIVHRSRRAIEETYLNYIRRDFIDGNVDYSLKGTGFKVYDAGSRVNLYPKDELVAKACERVAWKNDTPRSSDSEIYDKWSQALSSATELITDATKSNPEHLIEHKIHSLHFILPIVVVPDDTLWTVDYEDDGSSSGPARVVSEISYFVDRGYMPANMKPFRCSHVHFVTESKLTEFIWQTLNDTASIT